MYCTLQYYTIVVIYNTSKILNVQIINSFYNKRLLLLLPFLTGKGQQSWKKCSVCGSGNIFPYLFARLVEQQQKYAEEKSGCEIENAGEAPGHR